MLEIGSRAPDFSLPKVTDDGVEVFHLSAHLHQAPLVIVFFPGAFTGTCRSELATFRDRRESFTDAGATLLGLSVDTTLVLSAFQDAEAFGFPLLADTEREVISAYDVTADFPERRAYDVAARAIVVIDADQRIAWTWRDEPASEPDYDAVLEAVANAAETESLCASDGDERA